MYLRYLNPYVQVQEIPGEPYEAISILLGLLGRTLHALCFLDILEKRREKREGGNPGL